MRLEALLRLAGLNDPVEGGGPEVGRVVHDSRVVVTGDLFCCVPGDTYDGHDFAEGAVMAGAAAVLAERTLDLPVPVVIVNSVRRAMPHLVAAAERWPSRELDLVGVTGTNGKTSVVHLLDAVLERAGRTTATHGTLSGGRTTPEATDLQPLLRSWVATGVDAAAIEVSSHALCNTESTGRPSLLWDSPTSAGTTWIITNRWMATRQPKHDYSTGRSLTMQWWLSPTRRDVGWRTEPGKLR